MLSHSQYELVCQQTVGGFGDMLAFEMKEEYDAVYNVIRQTKFCLLALSALESELGVTLLGSGRSSA